LSLIPSKNTIIGESSFERRRLSTLASTAWLFLLIFSIGFYIITVWAYYRVLLTDPFFGSTVAPRLLNLESVRFGLSRFGLTIGGYAGILISGQGLTTIICCILGILIYWRRPVGHVAWLMPLILVLIGTLIPVQAYALTQLYPSLGFVGFLTNQIGTIVNLVLIWIFPNGRFVPSWSRWTFILTILVGVLATLFPVTPFTPLVIPISLILVGSGLLAQVYRYKYVSNFVERQQTKWVIFALIIAPLVWAIGGLLLPAIFPALTHTSDNAALYNLVRTIINNFASLLIPLAIGISILSYRLWDIDVIIRRTLVYSVLTLTLGMIYFGSVLVLQNLFQALTGRSQSPIVIVISTLTIAALFNPLRKRIQRDIDRRFYRRKYDADKMLEAFAASLRQEVNLGEISQNLLAVATDSMQPEKVSLWVKPFTGQTTAARFAAIKEHEA
jgi:hypothetical protein